MNNSFTQYGLSNWMVKAIDRMQYKNPTPVQQKTIKPFLKGADLIVQAPTGTGKTCAFGIPLCEGIEVKNKCVQALILSPTRELAKQTADTLRSLTHFQRGIRMAVIYGGENIHKQMAALRGRPHIIVATPGRLMDHIARRTVKLQDVHTVVLDEADRMLDMGFRKDMDKILGMTPKARQTVLFSATMGKDILAITRNYQRDARHIQVKQEAMTAPSIEQYYTKVKTGGKMNELVSLLEQDDCRLALVFVNTKRMADRLTRQLKAGGFRSDALHGDMSQPQREKVMRQYRQGKISVLVATDVAARGIDVNNIDTVINYDLPQDSESYVHRIGRTGRASSNGVAHTFIYPNETGRLRAVMRDTRANIKQARNVKAAV